MAIFVSPSAMASVTLTGPETVKFSYNNYFYHGGDVIEGNPNKVFVVCSDGYILNKVFVNGKEAYNYDTATKAETSLSAYKSQYPEGLLSIEATTIRLADVQTASFTIKSEKDFWNITWSLSFYNFYSYEINAGETTVRFIPGKDQLNYRYSHYTNFYCIKKNGVELNLVPENPNDYGNYTSIEDGDVFEVVTPVPDTMCRVTISSPNGETGFLSKAYYITKDLDHGWDIYHEVENPLSFEAPAGTRIRVEWNFDDYKSPLKANVNGSEIELNSIYNFNVPVDREDINITLEADPWKYFDVQVDVDDASRLIISEDGDIESAIPIHDGLQTISVHENKLATFYPLGGWKIESILVNGVDQVASGYNDYRYRLPYETWESIFNGTAGDGIIHITTGERKRDIPVKVFVNDCNGTAKLWTDGFIKPYNFDIHDGENDLMMCQQDFRKLMMSFNQDDSMPEGDVLFSPYGARQKDRNLYYVESSSAFEYAVINYYGNGYPGSHKLTVTSEFEDSEYELKQDYLVPLKKQTYYNIAEGSTFHVNMLGATGADVIVNGKKLESASPMSHVFTVTEPASVEIKRVTTTGVEEVDADNTADAVYYNMQGVRVDNPGKGVYIEVRGGKASKVMF